MSEPYKHDPAPARFLFTDGLRLYKVAGIFQQTDWMGAVMQGIRSVVLFFSVLCLLGAPAHAFSPAIQHGLAWLDTRSGASGALVANVPFPRQGQAEALTTYHQLGQALLAALRDLALDAQPVASDLLARKITAMRQTGASPVAELERLLALQNRDGDCGISEQCAGCRRGAGSAGGGFSAIRGRGQGAGLIWVVMI
jgi:hypothetical protein